MRLRLFAVVPAALGAVALGPNLVGAEEAVMTPPAAQTTPIQPPVGGIENVEVRGTVPDMMAGTWLMIQSIKPHDDYVNSWTLYRIEHTGKAWAMHQLVGTPPPALADAIKQANDAGKVLEMTPELLQQVATMANSLHPPRSEEANREYVFATPDQLPPEQQKNPVIQKSKLTLGVATISPSSTGANNYIFQDMQPDRLSGPMQAGVVARPAGLPPVPFAVDGIFTMYRLDKK